VLQRTKGIPETLADVTARFSGYLVILLGVGIGLAAIGIDVQPLLAIVLVVAAFVLKGVADNFAAGVLLQTSHPVAPGDEITVETPDGTATGTVVELGSRTVVVAAYDRRTVHVPNAQLVKDAIVVTPAGGLRRSEVQVRVERAGEAVDALLARLSQAVGAVTDVSAEPAPQASASRSRRNGSSRVCGSGMRVRTRPPSRPPSCGASPTRWRQTAASLP
jgi:small conductance mechanosensitive channel